MIYLALLLAGSVAQTSPEAEPRGNPADWIKFQDFPADALREKKGEAVAFRITVDAAGAPVNCSIEQSSGSRRIDDVVCDQLMRNGRFQPAKNAEGLAIAGQWTSRIRLANSTPSTSDQVGLSYDAEFEYRVDRDGNAIGCRSIRAVNIPPVNCSDALRKRVITPPSSGKFNDGVIAIHTTRTFAPN
ncbi:MAG: TonB family protein [Sphingomonadales bacterium]|nr:TonB family protein [Sphingomonadales bacterium]